jgi:hypothetical protein
MHAWNNDTAGSFKRFVIKGFDKKAMNEEQHVTNEREVGVPIHTHPRVIISLIFGISRI